MCRVLTSIKGAPAEYGMEASRLKPFEKLLQTLEGKLMEGKLFKVYTCILCSEIQKDKVTHHNTNLKSFLENDGAASCGAQTHDTMCPRCVLQLPTELLTQLQLLRKE